MENQPVAASAPVASVPVSGVKYAGFWIRWVARFVDGLIVGIPVFIVQLVVAGSIVGQIKQGGSIVPILASIVVGWLYFILMTHYKGATLGKMLVGIKVVSEDMTKLSFGKVILRETVGKIVSAIILYIGFIIAAFTAKKQALHDMMVKSVVVYKDPNNQSKTGLIAGIVVAVIFGGLVVVAIVGILSSVVLVSLNSARQKGKDVQVKSYLMSIRPNAEIYYAAHNNSYSVAQNCFTGMFADPNVAQLIGQLQNANPICHAEGSTYAVSVSLINPPSEYCVDSTAFSGAGRAQSVGSKASCGSISSVQTPSAEKQKETTKPYSYTLPTGWEYAPQNPQGLEAVQAKNGYLFSVSSGQLSDKLASAKSITDVVSVDDIKNNLKKNFPTVTILSVTTGVIGGEKAIIAKVNGAITPDKTKQFAVTQYTTMHNNNGYTFVFISPYDKRVGAATDFDSITRSFLFK